MQHVEQDEGQYVADLIYGRGERPRTTAPEPALLPHLGAYLCHDFSIEEILRAAWEFARGSMAPPWMPLWEATLRGVANREDLESSLDNLDIVTANHWRVVRTLHESNLPEAELLATQRIDIGPEYPQAAGAARLAPLLSRKQFGALIADSLVDPATLDPESVRSILVAAGALSIDLPDTWIDAALNGDWMYIPPESRQAHVLPNLPSKRRAGLADSLATWVTELHLPPDMRALWVSRIAPFVSSREVWDFAELLDGLEPVWHAHLEKMLALPWPAEPWADVFRAHPESEQFSKVVRPHETANDAAIEIRSRWEAHSAMAAPERGVDIEDTAAPPAPPMEPRRLQADVLLEDSMKDVTAFVADQTHLVEVSIGRGARIRADADIDVSLQEEFEKTDQDWIVLPVWFRAHGQEQSAKLRVPRDEKKDSKVVTFSFTAPANGRVLARIHVMRPGGRKLLQSAILAGDVVASVAEAEAHDPDIELNVDVVAGSLNDPAVAEEGQSVITDGSTAVTEKNGSLVEIDVSQLQEYLVRLVHEIETAADRHGRDDTAIEKTLVTLAIAGQQLRATFEPQLGSLAEESPLQITSLQSGDILPLELVYDGPPLSSSSKICRTWRQALGEGNCNKCEGRGPDNDEAPARVCPMRFWSMHKIIERRTKDTRSGRFHVAAERSAGRPGLRPIEATVVAASGLVKAKDVADLREYAATELNVVAKTAENWAEWIDVIHDNHPELLIAMPHNQRAAGGLSSALMMGEPSDEGATPPPESELMAGNVRAEHVQLSNDRPGPIVLLLGCNTQFKQGQLAGFAGEFRQNGAALTVGTLGELRVDHAPHAAQTLLEQIIKPPQNAKSIGEVLLSTRRQLLGDGMIMALLLVGNGDAEWLLPQQGASDDEDT